MDSSPQAYACQITNGIPIKSWIMNQNNGELAVLLPFLEKLADNEDDARPPALQIRAGQRSITANLRPLTAHIYHAMIIVTGNFSKKFSLLLFFPRNSFERS